MAEHISITRLSHSVMKTTTQGAFLSVWRLVLIGCSISWLHFRQPRLHSHRNQKYPLFNSIRTYHNETGKSKLHMYTLIYYFLWCRGLRHIRLWPESRPVTLGDYEGHGQWLWEIMRVLAGDLGRLWGSWPVTLGDYEGPGQWPWEIMSVMASDLGRLWGSWPVTLGDYEGHGRWPWHHSSSSCTFVHQNFPPQSHLLNYQF